MERAIFSMKAEFCAERVGIRMAPFITQRGIEVVQDGGGIFGFQTPGYRLPEQGLYVSVLSNGAASPSGVAAQAAVKAMLEEPYRINTVAMSDDELNKYVGNYLTTDGDERNLIVEDSKLQIAFSAEFKLLLTPIGDGLFQTAFGDLQFGGDGDAIEYLDVQRFATEPSRWKKQN